ALVRFRHLMQAHGLARAARQHELECPGGLDDDLAGIEVERVALGACRALAAARDAVADAERIDRRRDLGAVTARESAPALFLHLQIAADEMQAADRSARRLAAEHMAETAFVEPGGGELVLETREVAARTENASIERLEDTVDVSGERRVVE